MLANMESLKTFLKPQPSLSFLHMIPQFIVKDLINIKEQLNNLNISILED